ncbi:hypothetical protein [uncultured Variovorax sp.]|uniref:hypothetical protein n=1 Tax=uncultured Variovorax sp. TaxID=114708 RepID=UPI00262AD2BC|nr:hypothetical protein [uncultured Variovorax sp.]
MTGLHAAGAAGIPPIVRAEYARLAVTLATAGWEIDEIALDLTRTGPKAEIRVGRHDGRWMLARVDQLGRASIERFQRERSLGMATNGTGRRPLSPQIDDIFLGRSRFSGPDEMLLGLTQLLVDNALSRVDEVELQRAWSGLWAQAAGTRLAYSVPPWPVDPVVQEGVEPASPSP